jgi:hypothetical protein
MTSSSASDHGNPARIAALIHKGTTSKGMEVNKHFCKWLSCGRRISGTFGLHHIVPQIFIQNWNEPFLVSYLVRILPMPL